MLVQNIHGILISLGIKKEPSMWKIDYKSNDHVSDNKGNGYAWQSVSCIDNEFGIPLSIHHSSILNCDLLPSLHQ